MVDKKQHEYQPLAQEAPPAYDDAVSLVARTSGLVTEQPVSTAWADQAERQTDRRFRCSSPRRR